MPVKNESGSARSVSRSGSLFGTIKSILPSKLPWFGSAGDLMDMSGKRKGVDEIDDVEGDQRSSKRMRIGSPVRDSARVQGAQVGDGRQAQLPPTAGAGYLEPPDDFFGTRNPVAAAVQPSHGRATSLAPSSKLMPSRSIGRVFSPAPSVVPRPLGRTQSMDPPNRYLPTAGAYKPGPISRDVSMDDGAFNKEASPSPTQPFRMRTSLTPQPSGMAFGPEPTRRERNDSEPPPLSQLIDKPMFVKAPSEAAQAKHDAPKAPATLGDLAEAQRNGKGVQRSRSVLKIGSDSSMQDVTAPAPAPTVPINTTEKILRELEVYKTPLLPTRLRGSSAIPDMFKYRKGHTPVLMHDREHKPRLGTSDKGLEKGFEEGQSPKPYAGRGGMKKLLARRRMEEEEEKEKEKAAAIETDEDEAEATSRKARDLDERLVKELTRPLKTPEPEPFRPLVGGRPQSSLRVGRERTSRNHIARPRAKPRRGRFSALYEEDEDTMDDGREAQDDTAKKVSSFQPPPGFSFAKDHDTTNAKEPPIASLPFSLTKSASAPITSAFGSSKTSDAAKDTDKGKESEKSDVLPKGFNDPTNSLHPSPPITVAAESHAVSAPAPLTPLINAVPQIALIPPSPGPAVLSSAPKQSALEQLDASITGKGSSSVPNFFANSAALSKSTQVSLPSNFSFGVPPQISTTTSAAKETPSLFGTSPIPEESDSTLKSLFGKTNTGSGDEQKAAETSKAPLVSAFANPFSVPKPTPASVAEPVSERPAAATPPIAGSAFSFSKPSENQDAPSSPFTFGASKAPEAPATTPSPLPFAFGAPPKAETAVENKAPAVEAPKPAFTFGAASNTTQSSLFGGISATPSPSAVEPAKSPFTFGQPSTTASTAPSNAPTTSPPKVEAPKPLFSTTPFTFGQPPAASTPEPAKSPFTFGTTPSTPTAEASKPFVFGAPAGPSTPAPASGSTLFGTPVNGTENTRTVTPPKKDDSIIMMDESPLRSTTMEINGKPEPPKLSGGFSFGSTASTSTPFGQPSGASSAPFSFGATTAPNPFAPKAEDKPTDKPASPFTFGQTSASTGFGFGQKSADNGTATPSPGGFTFGQKAPETATATTGGFTFGQKAPEVNVTAPSTGGFAFGQKATEVSTAAPSAGAFSFASPATPSTTSGFAFGAPPIAQSTSFGQAASGASSTAVSPNPFSQPTQPSGFNFSAATPTSATAASNPFAFGSAPASPAAVNATLPGQNGATGFTFGNPGAATASTPSPFAAPSALPPPGGPVFTIGAPPPSTPVAGRQMKKLPTRRGGKR